LSEDVWEYRNMMTYTLPAANHTCPHKIRALLECESWFYDGMVYQELVELRNKLLQLAESEE